MKVPKLRFKEFTDQWQTKTLGEVFEILSGTTPSRAILGYFGGEFNWVKTTDLNNSLINDTQEKVTDRALSETSLRVLPKGTVLIAMYGGFNQIGRTGLLTRNAAINQALSALLPKLELVHPYFLLNYLNYRVDDWKSFAASSRKDPNITKNDVKNFTFVFSTLNEQTKIANFLTAIDEKITQLTQKCDLLAQYKKGVMQQIFSLKLRFKDDDGREFSEWEEKKLGDIGIFKSGTGFPENMQGGKTGIPFYKVSDMNIEANDITMKIANHYVTDDQIKIMKSKVIKETAIIFAKVGAAIFLERKRIASNFLIDNNMMAFIPNANIQFIKQYFDTLTLSKFAQVGALPSYNSSDLTIIKVNIPSETEQTKIADYLTAIDDKITQAQAQLDAVKCYKKGLLQQMFV